MSVSPVMNNTPVTAQKRALTASPQAAATDGSNAADENTGSGSVSPGSSAQDLMDNFMNLFIAQMNNQDPTNPMDNNQLTSQLAQISTLSGIQSMNETLQQVGGLIYSQQQMDSSNWVGRSVLIAGDPSVSTAEGGNQRFGLDVGSDADKVTVTLKDKDGNAYTAEIKDIKAGTHAYTMDDLENFQPAEPSKDTEYKVSFSASNEDGTVPKITALKWAKVDAISFPPGGGAAELQLGVDGTATLGTIYMVD